VCLHGAAGRALSYQWAGLALSAGIGGLMHASIIDDQHMLMISARQPGPLRGTELHKRSHTVSCAAHQHHVLVCVVSFQVLDYPWTLCCSVVSFPHVLE
jgi:hypothetical protein